MRKDKVELLSNPYGEVAYETFGKLGRAIVDKTLVIKDLEDKKTPLYPVLLRPRRFGKSTFVQMLKCFYDISYKDRYDEIFSTKKIYAENLASHNTYHVIYFNFSGISGYERDTLIDSFIIAVDLGIADFMERYPDFVFNPTEAEKKTPSGFIRAFFKAYKLYPAKKSLYIMIDEYDNFANSVLSEDLELFKVITSSGGFLKDFYSAIKDGASSIVAKTFITGVSSVSLDSLTSGFNISRNVTSRSCFNEYAGFTEEELAELIPQLLDLEKIGVSADEIIARMKPVYDGYCFSQEAEHTVFNSSMCLYYLDEMSLAGKFLPPEDYLDPASDHDGSKLQQLFDIAEDGLADEIIKNYLDSKLFVLDKLVENINLNKKSKYNWEQLLSMLYYLGYLTIDREASDSSSLALKIPNLFMSKLFAQCIADMRLKTNSLFTDPLLDISALMAVKDDLSTFATSCTEFMSSIFTNQVLTHMSEMALNLTLYTKLKSIRGILVEMQKSLRIVADGEKFADLVVTVNKGESNECVYLIELKYAAKTDATESKIQNLIKEASEQVLKYRSAMEFRNRQIKAYAMVFAGSNCVYCRKQE
ncbi:MAG: AAA family ATPase [Succinivibrionaceae bacterium]|nr:AAA family ATPase [Succinivibrionaceae bacterium]